MSTEDCVILALVAGNCFTLAWALGMKLKNRLLREELFRRSQWNLRQIKRFREGKHD